MTMPKSPPTATTVPPGPPLPRVPRRPDLLFVSWAPYCSRSDGIAARLGGRSEMVYAGWLGSHPATILLKYFVQSVQTFGLLLRRRPRVVFVMVPPIIICFPVWLYCLLFRARMVIDAHTGAFLHPRWEPLQFLQRFFSRRATTTIVTNGHLQELVESWDAHATLMYDVPVVFAEPEPVNLEPGHHVTAICSYCDDEPTDVLIEAAARMPDVQFHLTGNHSKLPQSLLSRVPDNLHFTGFLSDGAYVGQLLASDAVLALTIRDHTMQRGAYEAIYLERPVVTSRFGILLDAFPRGAVHVDDTVDDLIRGIRAVLDEPERFTREAAQLRQEKLRRWEEVSARLNALLKRSNPGADTPATASDSTAHAGEALNA